MNETIKQVVIGLSVVGIMALTGCGGGGGSDYQQQPQPDPQPDPVVDNWELPYEDNNKTIIDALIVYSDDVNAYYEGDAETKLTHTMEVANQIFNQSRTGVAFNVVTQKEYAGIGKTNGNTKELHDALVIGSNDTTIAKWRDETRADVVLMYSIHDDKCGLAYANIHLFAEYAFAVMSSNCGGDSTAHEIGHLMGNQHSHIQGDTGTGRYPYSMGHLVENDFGTVMTYAEMFGATRKMVFSNPDLECNGQPCGVKEGEVGESDVSRSIREAKQLFSEFRLKDGETPAPKLGDQTHEFTLPEVYSAIATITPPYEELLDFDFLYSGKYYSNRSEDGYFYISGKEIFITDAGIEYFKTSGVTEVTYLMITLNQADVKNNPNAPRHSFYVTLKIK